MKARTSPWPARNAVIQMIELLLCSVAVDLKVSNVVDVPNVVVSAVLPEAIFQG